MRYILTALVLVMVGITGCAAEMTVAQESFFNGIGHGFQMGVLYNQAQGDNETVDMWNRYAQGYNNWLNDTLSPEDARSEYLRSMEYINTSWLPPVLQD